MAGDGEDETEYESDPEEVKMSLKMRRREASDDEEEDEEGEEEEEEVKGDMTSARASDVESDGQGGAAEYDDEELEEEEEYYDEYEEEEEEVEVVAAGEYVENGAETGAHGVTTEAIGRDVVVGELNEGDENGGEEQIGEQGEKKENEPFMVPTAGAFYMHDDRFRENMVGRNRRTLGGRRLWESKDEKKWGHDKFEEMNTSGRPYDEGRKSSRGRSRGRGRGRGGDRGYMRGGARPRSYSEENNNNNINNVAPKTVRGRGPRRYQALTKVKNEGPLPPNKQSQKPLDKASHGSLRRADASAPHMDSGPLLAKTVASNLNSASPPFYPSGASKKESAVNQKRDDQAANGNRNNHPIHENSSVQQSNSSMRGKNVVGSVGMEKLYIDPPQSKGPNSFRSSPSQNQISKNSSAAQTHSGQRNHAQGRGQSSSMPNSSLSITVLESGDADLAESSKSKTDLVGKGKVTTHGSGRGSFLYSGIPVVGSGGHGDQNFPGTPAFLPVMQYGAPGVGMAFPGYVAQPQPGMGNSEMTWLPFLTGAGGALGASYLPPYVAVDGTYHARPASQTPALPASSKDNNVNKPNNEGKSQQKSDPVNDEFSQRQKPRRYSEMNFGQ